MLKVSYIKRKKISPIILLTLWLIFNKNFFLSQVASIKKNFSLVHLSPEEKYKLIDGQFYDFVKFCQKEIPENENIIFIDISKDIKEHTPEWVKSGYFKQRFTYYLCPRETFWVFGNFSSVDEKTYRIVFEITPSNVSFRLYYPGQKIR